MTEGVFKDSIWVNFPSSQPINVNQSLTFQVCSSWEVSLCFPHLVCVLKMMQHCTLSAILHHSGQSISRYLCSPAKSCTLHIRWAQQSWNFHLLEIVQWNIFFSKANLYSKYKPNESKHRLKPAIIRKLRGTYSNTL